MATRQANLTAEERAERADELAEIKAGMHELIDRARGLLRGTGITGDRARAYWLAHILTALDDDHGYLGGSMCTMDDTIRELGGDDEEDDNRVTTA